MNVTATNSVSGQQVTANPPPDLSGTALSNTPRTYTVGGAVDGPGGTSTCPVNITTNQLDVPNCTTNIPS